MKYVKISFKELKEKIDVFALSGFQYPDHYRLAFPVLQVCKCCKKPFFTRKIHLFEDEYSAKIVCNCSHCGGRHKITTKNIEETILSYKIMAGCGFALLLIICA